MAVQKSDIHEVILTAIALYSPGEEHCRLNAAPLQQIHTHVFHLNASSREHSCSLTRKDFCPTSSDVKSASPVKCSHASFPPVDRQSLNLPGTLLGSSNLLSQMLLRYFATLPIVASIRPTNAPYARTERCDQQLVCCDDTALIVLSWRHLSHGARGSDV
jgi:hypothetical protein